MTDTSRASVSVDWCRSRAVGQSSGGRDEFKRIVVILVVRGRCSDLQTGHEDPRCRLIIRLVGRQFVA
jgi:hypothetical protein